MGWMGGSDGLGGGEQSAEVGRDEEKEESPHAACRPAPLRPCNLASAIRAASSGSSEKRTSFGHRLGAHFV
jgi:hypothetical protein